MNCKTLLIKQVLPGLVVLAIGFSEQGLNVSLPGENLNQPVPADERLPGAAPAGSSEADSADSQSEEGSPKAGNFWEWAAEWVGEYTLPASSQKTTFTSGNNTFRAEPGSIWALAAWNLILFDFSPYSPGIRGSEIGLRSALKSLSP